ncbi:MAG: NAD(P)-binding domain-containing protein [Synergistes sp.]|nr:NAD(P)-binding domain-containing protein [Synergistes sp.]
MQIASTLGFIGTGGITSALVEGLLSAEDFKGNIILSVHKNREKPDRLKAMAPDRVSLSYSNQEIADSADVVFVAVLPQDHKDVVTSLTFTPDKHIVQISGGIQLDETRSFYDPATLLSRAVPLPFTARRMGPVLLYGNDLLVKNLFAMIGTVVEVKHEAELCVLGPVTGMMVPYYGLLAEYVKWGMEKGLDFRTALDYCCCMNEALSSFMRTDCGSDIEKFLNDNTTPGGVNELGLDLMRSQNAYNYWKDTLDKLYVRYNSLDKAPNS